MESVSWRICVIQNATLHQQRDATCNCTLNSIASSSLNVTNTSIFIRSEQNIIAARAGAVPECPLRGSNSWPIQWYSGGMLPLSPWKTLVYRLVHACTFQGGDVATYTSYKLPTGWIRSLTPAPLISQCCLYFLQEYRPLLEPIPVN